MGSFPPVIPPLHLFGLRHHRDSNPRRTAFTLISVSEQNRTAFVYRPGLEPSSFRTPSTAASFAIGRYPNIRRIYFRSQLYTG